jgi:hypothetical protein
MWAWPAALVVVLAFLTVAAGPPRSAAAGRWVGHLIPVSRLAQKPPSRAPRVVPQLSGLPASIRSPHTAPVATATTGALPTVHESFQGIFDPGITPPDVNGAAGPNRQVEIVNQQIGIWDRSSPPSLLAQATLQALTGSTGSALYDPRVMWDPQTSRFYYSVADDTNDALLTGFSTTANPNSAADWCKYAIPTPNLIDQPHLGDSKYFVLAGFFLYYSGPEVAWYAKPPVGSSCPATLASGTQAVLPGGNWPPAPAHEIDSRATGYVLAGSGNQDALDVIRVTKNTSGAAVFSAPSSIAVAPFTGAPPAPQAGTSQLIDLVDARLNGVIGAVDPSRAGKFALWTQHTVAGGAGSMIRWYEIDPSSNSLFQSGAVASSTLWVYNGAISPDRLVNGSVAKFGGSMVLGFNTSSSTTHIAIRAVSKVGTGPQSAPLLIKSSKYPYISYDCSTAGSTCHWGDYAGAEPDPAANPTATHGAVWGADEWNVANPNPTGGTAWRTWEFTASP